MIRPDSPDSESLAEGPKSRCEFLHHYDSPSSDLGDDLNSFFRATKPGGDRKTFSIEASGAAADAAYIQSVKLNGLRHEQNWVPFHAITAGGTLHFTMGAKPNESWGSAPKDAPPSLSGVRPYD